MMEELVRMNHVTKKFPGVTALNNISFDIRPGEVHVLLGENGAGKSTLMKILSGVYQPTEGTITIKGKEFERLTPADSYENGISVIYQELSVIKELSIAENLFVGRLPVKRRFGIDIVDYDTMKQKAKAVMEQIGMKRDPMALVEYISTSEKQQVEIAKALVSNADIIVMDEPTTSLTNVETENLFRIIRDLKQMGKGIVFISHKLNEIKAIGDRVTVLKDGTYVGTREVRDTSIDQMVTMMVGREISGTYLNEAIQDFSAEPVIFEADHLTTKDGSVQDVSFTVRRGEIVGFAGLIGAGRTELMNALFGVSPLKAGTIKVAGKAVENKSPYHAIRNGFAMVTENRRETGFMHNFDIKQNISIISFLKNSSLFGMTGHVDNKYERSEAEIQKKALRIKCRDIDQNIVELSGGNQQKVILGKWMAANSQVVIFDEPTKGIDVGSKSEIYELMRILANEGKVILVVSSELPELLSVSDTIHAYREGHIVATFRNQDATEEKIVLATTGENQK
ncbi:ATP-binding cassette domain-containing protein [Proteiniclasticum sp. QWL-01]|uniref:sugar ABC transporter ATP-binding protein n=1 Tax=Proteiniclasticum sp. QWL-01 TaxID=3036945 RepID=UPI00241144ED|nr:ATP-binding cassette domain-containing protein [Proteiniclasticum sp. QWL-01]WFF74371.1 ATP-binding cassette domain-containing protein [Proteiniclasticum sp. QWL-01]